MLSCFHNLKNKKVEKKKEMKAVTEEGRKDRLDAGGTEAAVRSKENLLAFQKGEVPDGRSLSRKLLTYYREWSGSG